MDTASSSEGIKGPRRSKLESNLRQLEVDAYCALISVFRAQGELTWKKESILQDLRQLLRISDERHKMELKRVREDENLCEIAKLSAGLHLGEAEIESIVGDEKARQKKKQKTNWNANKDQSVPPMDVVAAPAATHPNYNKTPAKDTKPKGKPQSKAKPAPKAGAKGGEGRKRKPAAGKKGGSKVKPKPKPEEELVEDPVAAMEAEEEAEEVDEAEAARIKEIEATLKAKQEQLRAELAALHASMAEPNGEGEGEGEGAETGGAAETPDDGTVMEQAPVSEEAEAKDE